MRSAILASISTLVLLGAAGSAGAQSTCSNTDITGRWMFEVTAYFNAVPGSPFTMLCPVNIRPNRVMDNATCTQVDSETTQQSSLSIAAPFTVASNCLVRSNGNVVLTYNRSTAGGSAVWLMDALAGRLYAGKNTFTASASLSDRHYLKITGHRL